MVIQFWLEILEGREHSKHSGAYGRTQLKYILGTNDLRVWIGFIWLRQGFVVRLL
jgi:hypothetical protein